MLLPKAEFATLAKPSKTNKKGVWGQFRFIKLLKGTESLEYTWKEKSVR